MSVTDSRSDVSEDQDGGAAQQEDWEDWQDDGEGQGFKSLFTDARFAGLEEVLAHDQKERGFNLAQYRSQVRWCWCRHAMHAASRQPLAVPAAADPRPAAPSLTCAFLITPLPDPACPPAAWPGPGGHHPPDQLHPHYCGSRGGPTAGAAGGAARRSK